MAALAALALLGACGGLLGSEAPTGRMSFPGASWTQAASPEALGWSSAGLALARAYSDSIGSAAVMIVDAGTLVQAWGDTARPIVVQSARKSFLSALFGILEAEAGVDLSATLAQLGIDDSVPPSLTTAEKRATVGQLLQARSGVYHEAAAEAQWMKDARPARGSHAPGTFYYYNNWDFNSLGTIYRRLAGVGVFEGMERHLAAPLQMEDFSAADGVYQYEPVSEHPAYHFEMSARDMARFGLLYLADGRWRDRQILPRTWVDRSAQAYSDADANYYFGYMWWVAKPQLFPGHTVWAARGGSGHAVFVVRDLGVVIAHHGEGAASRPLWAEVHELLRRILSAKR
jgi:CubicO group peptidase (beta-lactamase class C family)